MQCLSQVLVFVELRRGLLAVVSAVAASPPNRALSKLTLDRAAQETSTSVMWTSESRDGWRQRHRRRAFRGLAMFCQMSNIVIELKKKHVLRFSLIMAALRSRCGHYILVLFLSSFFLALSQRSQIGCLPYFYTWCGRSANLECRSEMWCTRLAGNAGPKKIAKNSPSGHHRRTLSGYIFATKAYIDSRKNLLNSNIFPTCSHNMVNFGPLTAEIRSGDWGTPADVIGFRVVASLLHGTLVVGIS